MNTKFSAVTAAALLAIAGVAAHAQGTVGNSGAPKGELSTPNQDKGSRVPKGSTEDRAEVKAEAKDARKAGDLPAGEKSTRTQDKGPSKRMSSESRAEVKADAKAAERAGAIPKGEESVKDQNKGGKKATP